MTERERIELLREGYVQCIKDAEGYGSTAPTSSYMRLRAETAYPMPKTKRPRTVWLRGTQYRVVDGVVQFRFSSSPDDWRPATKFYAEYVRKLADLLDNPVEEVEE